MTFEELYQENTRLRNRIAELEEENRQLRNISPRVLAEPTPVRYGKSMTYEERQAEQAIPATTAFGKTITALGMIAERKVNTLILVTTKSLMQQWKKRIEEFMEINEHMPNLASSGRGRRKTYSHIGTLDGTSNTLHGIIDIAVYNSASTNMSAKVLITRDLTPCS